jgi:hypothetical protein
MKKPHPDECACAICCNEKDFDFPEHLLDKIASGDVVIFAGAGISTENRSYCQSTLYEQIWTPIVLSLTAESNF